MTDTPMSPEERMAKAREAKANKQKEIEEKLSRLAELEKKIESQPENIEGMLPRSWRDVIDKGLGPDFKASVAESSGGNYIIKIVIPPQYDRRTGEQKQMMKEDYSTGIVRRASDIADVTRWCELIKGTIKSMYPDFK